MIELNEFTAQLEVAHWGWTIALFLWFVGLSGMGMFLNNWVRHKLMVYLCTAASIVGTLLVISHLTRILNLPLAAIHSLLDMSFNFTSWMFIGICLLVVQCCGTLFYSLVLGGVLRQPACERVVNATWFNYALAAVGVAVTIYSGFLLTQAVGVTLWNTALIPLLWIMSGMACALASIEIFVALDRMDASNLGWVHQTSLWVKAAELLTIFAFLHVASGSTSAAARAGAQALLCGPQSIMFWLGVIVCGLLVPMGISLTTHNRQLVAVGGLLGAVGALLLRACVLFAGYYEPVLL